MVAVVNNAINDKGSTTGSNLFKLQELTGLNPIVVSPDSVMKVLLDADQIMPESEKWRIVFLEKLLWKKRQREILLEDTEDLDFLIYPLCSS